MQHRFNGKCNAVSMVGATLFHWPMKQCLCLGFDLLVDLHKKGCACTCARGILRDIKRKEKICLKSGSDGFGYSLEFIIGQLELRVGEQHVFLALHRYQMDVRMGNFQT